jgi:hypothetical protein
MTKLIATLVETVSIAQPSLELGKMQPPMTLIG